MIVLFRVGDFYEAFGQSAEDAAKTLGLTITRNLSHTRGTDMAMAGFPHHQLETYLHKLLNSGRRVAVCDQVDEQGLPDRSKFDKVVVASDGSTEREEIKNAAPKKKSHRPAVRRGRVKR